MCNGIKITGRWNEGFVFDQYVKKSEYIGDDVFGHPQFNTEYTEIGNLLHAMKYNGHFDTSFEIASKCYDFLKIWLQDKNIDILLPIPPTVSRDVQPTFLITEAIADSLHIPYATDVLAKLSNYQAKNMNKANKKIQDTIAQLKPAIKPCNILLIDDIYSTGSTANECVSVLSRDALINNIYFFAIAKTK